MQRRLQVAQQDWHHQLRQPRLQGLGALSAAQSASRVDSGRVQQRDPLPSIQLCVDIGLWGLQLVCDSRNGLRCAAIATPTKHRLSN